MLTRNYSFFFQYVEENVNNTYWTSAAIAVLNSGAIRGDINNHPGIIKYEDLIIVAPFGNTYDLVELKGSDILKVYCNFYQEIFFAFYSHIYFQHLIFF